MVILSLVLTVGSVGPSGESLLHNVWTSDALHQLFDLTGTAKPRRRGEMTGKFINSTEVTREQLEWGWLAWFSGPTASNSKNLVVLEARLRPASGHSFHKHPNQEEVIYVIEGEIEQWVDQERRILRQGDSAFIGPDVVHASFNVSDQNASLLAILGPCIGTGGYEVVDVANREPWASLR